MKILILGPYDSDSLRKDLQLINRVTKDIYSSFFIFSVLQHDIIKHKKKDFKEIKVYLSLIENMTEKEYNSHTYVYGNANKKYDFDEVLLYDYEKVSVQEAALKYNIPDFNDRFYSIEDATKTFNSIGELLDYIK